MLWDIKKEILELTSVFTDIYILDSTQTFIRMPLALVGTKSSYYFITQVYLKMKCFGLKAFAILELLFRN